jgi:hypothetical protein
VTYRIAGIDVHKRMLGVVIADVTVEGEYQLERQKEYSDCRFSGCRQRSNRLRARCRPVKLTGSEKRPEPAQPERAIGHEKQCHLQPCCLARVTNY